MTIRNLGSAAIISILTTSCTTYYLTTDSLRNQFSGVDSTKLRMVTVRGPVGEEYKYLANPINEIECVDKKGNPSRLTNSPSIEMRVTQENRKRTIFYFDRVIVTDSTLHGVRSRFIPSINKTIKLRDIRKIEIQDGKKSFNYISSE
jgi:hypothetical protein